MKRTFSQYINLVSDYLDYEYTDGLGLDAGLSTDEKWTIRNILMEHYESGDSTSNAANLIIEYLRENREWLKKNQI